MPGRTFDPSPTSPTCGAPAGIDFKVGSKILVTLLFHRGDLGPCHVTSVHAPSWLSGVPRAKLLAVLPRRRRFVFDLCVSQVRSDHGHFNKKGNLLISDQFNNRAIEVTHDDNPQIAATFTAGGTVSGVAFASRLPNGNTLLTDSNNNRAVEVDPSDTVVWQYVTNNDPGSNPNPLPTRALRLHHGNTIISDQFNHRVIVVDPDGNIVASYGNLMYRDTAWITLRRGCLRL